MKKIKCYLAALCALVAVAQANTPAACEQVIFQSSPESVTLTYSPARTWADAEMKEGEDEENALRDALRHIKWVYGKPSLKAKYYVIVKVDRTSYKSCSGRKTHPTLLAEMTGIAKHHKDMKKDGRVELLFISGDKSKGHLKGCIKEFKTKFPAALLSDEEVHNLPGLGDMSRSFMGAVFVRASDGKVLHQDYSMKLVADWEGHLNAAEKSVD